MSRPLEKQSISGATSATAGETHKTSGHNSLGLIVEAQNLDTANDTLEAQVEARRGDGEWSPVFNGGSQVLQVGTADFADPENDGTFSVFEYSHGVPAPEVRVRVTAFTDSSGGDLSVDAYITATGNAAGRGHSYD